MAVKLSSDAKEELRLAQVHRFQFMGFGVFQQGIVEMLFATFFQVILMPTASSIFARRANPSGDHVSLNL